MDITNVVLGSEHFAGLHFTGSTQVFRTLWKTIGQEMDRYRSYPRIVGETGGKDFIFAHPSADVERLTIAALRGAFEYQGQKCSAASRMYIPRSIWGELSERLSAEMAKITMGDVRDFSNFMGAVIHEGAYKRISGAIERAKADSGTRVVAGGGCFQQQGWFIEPTLLECTDPQQETMHTELFGPVLSTYVLRRRQARRDPRALRPDEPLWPHRCGVGPGSPRRRVDGPFAASRGRQLLHQRQAHGCRREPAALRRCACIRYR